MTTRTELLSSAQARPGLSHTNALRGASSKTAVAQALSRGHSTNGIVGNETKVRRLAWCSWCKKHCEQELKIRRNWSRPIHECTMCMHRTLPCSRSGCQDFARGFLVPSPLGVMVPWHESQCLVCQGLITEWTEAEATRLEDGWCSWCFEETTQALWCSLPLPLRNLYQCTYCNKLTARCHRCPEGFSRSHADWCDLLCFVCSQVIDSWGALPAIDGKARIRAWCSSCVRHSVQDLEQLRSFHPPVYRCSNCHELTVACTTCKDATRLKTSLASSAAAAGCYTHTHTHKSTHTQDSTKAWAWECASLSPRIGEHGGGGGGEMVIVNGRRCVACLSSKMWSQLDREHREEREAHNHLPSQDYLLEKEQTRLLSKLELFSQIRILKKDQVLIQEGSTERSLMVVLEGTVLVERVPLGAKGRQKKKAQEITRLGRGQTVGELVFLKGGAANATVRSLHNDVSVLVMPRAQVLNARLHDQEGGGTEDVVSFYRFLAVRLCDKLRTLSNSSVPLNTLKPPHTLTHFDLICDRDEDVCEFFNIHASEYVTVARQSGALVHHAKRPLWGLVCATQSYVCFGADLFGQPTRFAFHFSKLTHITEIDQNDNRAFLQLSVEPLHDDDDENDSCFLVMFSSPEGRDLFAFALRAAHSQAHVWKQSRGRMRASYRVEPYEPRIFVDASQLAAITPGALTQKTSHGARGGRKTQGLAASEGESRGGGGEVGSVSMGVGGNRRPSSCQVESVNTELDLDEVYYLHLNPGMARLVEGAKAVTFDKDDVIIHEGNRDQRLYQIGIGSVRVEKGPFSTGTLLARLGPGQVFGEMSLIAGGGASASIVADEDNTTVYMFDADYLRAAVHEEPSVASDFYRYLAHLLADRFRNTTLTNNLALSDEAEGPQDVSSWRALTSNDSPSQSIALLSPSEQHTWGMKGLLQSMDGTKQLLQMGKSVHKKEKEGFRKSFFKNFQKSS